MMKINVIFYSLYGHNYRMAQAVAEGAREVEGAEVGLFQVQETFTPEILQKMGATESKKSFEHIPVATVDNLTEADAIIFGTPTRFGMMTAQMRAFLDRTGGIWSKGLLIGKVGSVFTSSSTQHGGQESSILSFHTTLLHHGMIIVGVPYSETRQSTLDEITGGSPYGASTIAGSGPDTRHPSENELGIARFQGRHVAEITKKLVGE
nr:NAD(P)H:quinone oxidoreductase [uncultured Methanolobus sp.]